MQTGFKSTALKSEDLACAFHPFRDIIAVGSLILPRYVKHAGGDFSAAGQAFAATGNLCLA